MSPESVLQKYWGYSSFRLSQKEVVESILDGQDTLALLPTGGGKSVCYQVPGLLFPDITLVITPLISLMKDQVDGLLKRNITATYLASTIEKSELDQRVLAIKSNQIKFVYASPEKLQSHSFVELITSLKVSLVVIDESHCVSLWGGNFRPSYLKIASFIDRLKPRPVVAALTATATPATKREIVAGLQLLNPQLFQSSFKRDISIQILTTSSITMHELHLLAYLKDQKQPGIIYTSSRKETERLSQRLNRLKDMLKIREVGCYHAGLSAELRLKTQQDFIDNKLQLLVATTAFGMGIDKPDIDFVVHYHPPANLEGYYQEIGRAGRGGKHSTALLLFNPAHLAIHENLATQEKTKKMFDDVKLFLRSHCCRMQSVLNYFGEKSESCGMCDRCISRASKLQTIINNKTQQISTLVNVREFLVKKHQIAAQMVLSDFQIAYWVTIEPRTTNDLLCIPGIGSGWLQLWARYFVF